MLGFWTIAAAITVMVGALLLRALMRGAQQDTASRAASDMEVYRAQLAEVDRDVARGVIAKADAERVHAEIARRLIAADKAQKAETPAQQSGPTGLAVGIIVLGILGSVASYFWLGAPGYSDMGLKGRIAFAEEVRTTRPRQDAAEASLPAFVDPPQMEARYKTLMAQLRSTVSERPDDLQGHTLLAQQERRIGNFLAAKKAQQRVLALKGAEAAAQDLADMGELQVLAAGGYVSPEAETSLRAALVQDPNNSVARYYLGLMLVQTGRPDQAFRIWDALLRVGPEDAPWIPPILSQIEELAELAGVTYALPDIGGSQPGPSAADIENAGQLTPAERMDMIGGMVTGLSERLATEGGPARDWARLISSLGVLGEWQRAAAIHANAIEVFADDPGAIDLINDAGRKAGVVE